MLNNLKVSMFTLWLVVMLGMGNSHAFHLDHSIIRECLHQRNFENNDYTKTTCQVTTKSHFNFEELEMTNFEGTCGLRLTYGEEKTILVFFKNPNRFSYSTHLSLPEAKDCLESFLE